MTLSINLNSWKFCMHFCRLLSFFSKKSYGNIIRVLNNLDPNQARHYVGPDLGPNCLQRSLTDDTCGQRKELMTSS